MAANKTQEKLIAQDTIVAPVTPPGKGGVAIVRVSGPSVKDIIHQVVKQSLQPRYAHHLPFYGEQQQVIDEGLALFFPGPHSFTGEDVLELQGHGGPVVVDQLVERIIQLGARMAKPGEFSERAFLNDKIDLAQAEAIADLINANNTQAAQSAVRSLQGEFSIKIHQLVEQLIHLRMHVESAIDFPEEEIDFLSDGKIEKKLDEVINQVDVIKNTAKQGVLLSEGMTIVIAGEPNVGKSSLLNTLSQRESAIVTDIAGTTRDILREYIHIDGLPLHIIDTAGLRESDDVVEKEGIKRAKKAMEDADEILVLADVIKQQSIDLTQYPHNKPITVVYNKIDLLDKVLENSNEAIYLSAKTGQGIDALKQHLKKTAGFHEEDGTFIARRRHLNAIESAHEHLLKGK
ncbi:MAG: tRNA uridine-5-carboxymethylaminomethyl(34) synthesis GTPase MnmE, partial [Legionellaceae bacterium]|nr:tRNA uridine-5-carboxymethylaminomethyl(34) synthesis GTPase MnmE [Legionellaceae bacterium]